MEQMLNLFSERNEFSSKVTLRRYVVGWCFLYSRNVRAPM